MSPLHSVRLFILVHTRLDFFWKIISTECSSCSSAFFSFLYINIYFAVFPTTTWSVFEYVLHCHELTCQRNHMYNRNAFSGLIVAIPVSEKPLAGNYHSLYRAWSSRCCGCPSLSSKMWPAWRDVSKKACGVWGHARKNNHKSKKELCRVLDYVKMVGKQMKYSRDSWIIDYLLKLSSVNREFNHEISWTSDNIF